MKTNLENKAMSGGLGEGPAAEKRPCDVGVEPVKPVKPETKNAEEKPE